MNINFRLRNSYFLGFLVLIAGIILLLQSLEILSGTFENVIFAVVLGSVGIYLLWKYISLRNRWWLLIISLVLIGTSISNILSLSNLSQDNSYDALIFAFSLGLGFFTIYLNDRIQWWGIIPGGVFITLGVISLTDVGVVTNINTETIFFFGIGLTFLMLSLLPTPLGRMKWAIFPALPLLLLGAFFHFGGDSEIWNFVGPSILILVGLYFIYRTFTNRKPEDIS